MVNKILAEGDKIEFREILSPEQISDGVKPTVYVSQIFDFGDRDNLKVAMPILKGRLVPLSKGKKYDTFFYTSKGLYQCRSVIVDRYKSGNIYTMEIEFTTGLQKYQRRQYYRLEKSLELQYIELTEHDYNKMIETKKFPENLTDITCYSSGITADISGGGMRFVGKKKIDSGKKMLVIFNIQGDGKTIMFRLPALVILSFELTNKTNHFEHRIEFENISNEYREILIKYIFEEERKMRSHSR